MSDRLRNGTRRTGRNPRALGTNPRALGTNPSIGTAADRGREAHYVLRAYAVLHRLGVWLCDDCDDTHHARPGSCSCTTLTPAEGRHVALTFGRMRDSVMAERYVIDWLNSRAAHP